MRCEAVVGSLAAVDARRGADAIVVERTRHRFEVVRPDAHVAVGDCEQRVRRMGQHRRERRDFGVAVRGDAVAHGHGRAAGMLGGDAPDDVQRGVGGIEHAEHDLELGIVLGAEGA